MRSWTVTYTATVKQTATVEAETSEEAVGCLLKGQIVGRAASLRKPYNYSVIGIQDNGEVELDEHDHEHD